MSRESEHVMRKCRVGKKLGNYYHSYGDMFEKMSLLDIIAWTIGYAAVSAAAGYIFGKITEYACDKIGGDVVTKDQVTHYTEKHTDNNE